MSEGRVISPEELFGSVSYRYHDATKHTVEKLMSGGHYLDWANQPNPFRHYHGATQIDLSRDITTSESSLFQVLDQMYSENPTHDSSVVHDADAFVSGMLYYSLAISAWKQIRLTVHRWALRANASSGNLHPTEAHLLLPDGHEQFQSGLYHYRSDRHSLELRSKDIQPLWNALAPEIGNPSLIVCLTSIHWREVWKYRERGFRYCQHDMGHAIGAITVAAASMGWTSRAFALFPDDAVKDAFGLRGTDEAPSVILALAPRDAGQALPLEVSHSPNFDLMTTDAKGEPNQLSDEVKYYAIIDGAYTATCFDAKQYRDSCRRVSDYLKQRRCSTAAHALVSSHEDSLEHKFDSSSSHTDESCHSVIRRRRSAVDMQYERQMSRDDLSTILASSTRGFTADFQTPLSLSACSPSGLHLIHLYVYAHRIPGLQRGLYFYDRYLQKLHLLIDEDMREISKGVSCFQDIAADASVALSMVADFNTAYELYGDRGYKLLHFEAGYIGQLLYLAATALGYDATGIGCFVDDAINSLLKLEPGHEVIYNFCIGEALLDPRLTSLPAYEFPDPTQS